MMSRWLGPVWYGAHVASCACLLAFGGWREAWFSNFDPRNEGHLGLLLMRGLLLASILIAARGRKRVAWLAWGLGTLVLVSFLVPGFVLGFAVLTLAMLVRLPPPSVHLPRPTRSGVVGAITAGLLCAAMAWYLRPLPSSRPRFPAPDASASQAARMWLAAGNLHRSRAAALAWARMDAADPGESYFLLAELDHLLGHHDKARKVLEKVRDRSSRAEFRLRASQLLQGHP